MPWSAFDDVDVERLRRRTVAQTRRRPSSRGTMPDHLHPYLHPYNSRFLVGPGGQEPELGLLSGRVTTALTQVSELADLRGAPSEAESRAAAAR